MRKTMWVVFISLVLCGRLAIAADEDVPFEIGKIKFATLRRAYVDNGWGGYVKCVQVDVWVKRDIAKRKVFARAYFYDKEGNLVENYQAPPQVSDDHKQYRSIPSFFEPGKKYDVNFPISSKIEKGKYKWQSMVVVFGDDQQAVAEVFKGTRVADYAFPEKELVLKTGK